MNNLCDQKRTGDFAHSARATVSGTDDATYAGQQLMSEMGNAYAPNISNWSDGMFRSLNREEQKDEMERLMKKKMDDMMEDSDYSPFGQRQETVCQLTCKLTDDEQKKLNDNKFRYRWGEGASRK